jgi:hypothetical protein
MDRINDSDSQKMLLEGLFFNNSNFKEVDYLVYMDEYNKIIDSLQKKINASILKKSIICYKNSYPYFYVLNRNDYRMFSFNSITEPFNLYKIARDSGLSETTVVNEIISIMNEVQEESYYTSIGAYYTDNTRTNLDFKLYTDQKFVLKRILNGDKASKKIKKEKISSAECSAAMKEYFPKVVALLQKHPLAKQMFINGANDNKSFRFGDGIAVQISTNYFGDSDFVGAFPNMNCYNAGVNVQYYVDSSLLNNTNYAASVLYNGNNAALFLITKGHIIVE